MLGSLRSINANVMPHQNAEGAADRLSQCPVSFARGTPDHTPSIRAQSVARHHSLGDVTARETGARRTVEEQDGAIRVGGVI